MLNLLESNLKRTHVYGILNHLYIYFTSKLLLITSNGTLDFVTDGVPVIKSNRHISHISYVAYYEREMDLPSMLSVPMQTAVLVKLLCSEETEPVSLFFVKLLN